MTGLDRARDDLIKHMAFMVRNNSVVCKEDKAPRTCLDGYLAAFLRARMAESGDQRNPSWCEKTEICEDEGPCITCVHRNGEVY